MDRHCPVCVEAQLTPKLREGVEIDVCPSCRGIWLDRGELEKLRARATSELDQYRSRDSEPPSSRRGYSKQGPHRKRSLLESLGDIFD
ncbi:MAG TPA: zf-TFIIB domain-containing protein [Polyangiaceae bacterium]|nr:zf-TFIIB domain-containing protein [Polyangiaceae bacterium]